MIILFFKPVVFRDMAGNIYAVYRIGDVIEAQSETEHYFVTPLGGVWKDEAVRLDRMTS